MKRTVLAVDDSATVRELLRTTLKGAGYQVVLATDGLDALRKLSDSPDNQFDMVLTDLNMPKMNGIELIRKVRQQPGHHFQPI